ncbi:MAG: protein kinase, partial [Verrucomicrobia bacterium]|nr:protein kinase [Verrucomicrobiota bacterium]
MTWPHQAKVEAFGQKHHTGLVALVFTDIVDSTRLKQVRGDRAAIERIERHHGLTRQLLAGFVEAEEVETAGDSFLLLFSRPSDAVRFALCLQAALGTPADEAGPPIRDRIGIHAGEVFIEGKAGTGRLFGMQVDTAARVASLAVGGQILMTRFVFDNARQVLRGDVLPGVAPLTWSNHGPYRLKGVDEPMEICEVAEATAGPRSPPADSEKAQRVIPADPEPVLGWRPALEQRVPGTEWTLEEKLGEGGFGEVWLGRHATLQERRVFKFCFRADRVRALKREVTLFRLLKERLGEHPHIVRLCDLYLDEPPFYLETEYVPGKDLASWCRSQGGVEAVPPVARLEIVAQTAEALQAAHEAGVIHRDVKPGNILVGVTETPDSVAGSPPLDSGQPAIARGPRTFNPAGLRVKLTDFGVGQVVSQSCLAGLTRAGFTQTILSGSQSPQTGTQIYMAPELLAGRPATTRSDIYSLGVVLYQLLVGDLTRPVTTDWAQEISDPLLRDDLQHCFAGHPHDRFANAGQMARNLRGLNQRREARAEQMAAQAAREAAAYRRGLVRATLVGAAAIGLLGCLVLFALRQTRLAQVAEFHAAQNARQALSAARLLDEQRQRAEAGELQARRNAYASDLNLAQQALQANNLGRALDLLNRHRPGAGQPDLRGWEWQYLWQRCQSDATAVLGQHSNSVKALAFAPDGRYLAAGDFDGLVKLWDCNRRHVITTLP